MNNNTLFQQLKQWGLKVSVSSIIFISVVLLGGAIITMALPSSLNDVKSSNANNQLTAENWDYLVEQVSGQVSKLTNLSGKISINTTNITSLSGKLATLSGTVNTLTNTTSSVRTKNGNNIYYSSGNVGIGLVPNYQYALDISGYMKIWGSILMTGVEGYGYVRPTQLTLYTYDNDADKGQIHITTKYSGQGGYVYVKGKNGYTSILPDRVTIGNISKMIELKGGEDAYIRIPKRATSISDRSSCYSEGTLTLANRNNDTNNSRLFICEKVSGSLYRVSLGGE